MSDKLIVCELLFNHFGLVKVERVRKVEMIAREIRFSFKANREHLISLHELTIEFELLFIFCLLPFNYSSNTNDFMINRNGGDKIHPIHEVYLTRLLFLFILIKNRLIYEFIRPSRLLRS